MKKIFISIAWGVCIMTSFHATVYGSNWFSGLFGKSIKGSGNVITETRHVKPFNEIYTSGSQDIRVTVGEEQSLSVTFDDNLIDVIETKVKGKTLYIEARESYQSKKGCTVVITVPELVGLSLSGSGDVSIEKAAGDFFDLSLRGSGDIIFTGTVDEMAINVSGSGDIYAHGISDLLTVSLTGSGDVKARDLIADDVEVSVKGSGDVSVYANERFSGTIYGSGDIRCYGNPEKTRDHIVGSGDITMK